MYALPKLFESFRRQGLSTLESLSMSNKFNSMSFEKKIKVSSFDKVREKKNKKKIIIK